MKTECQERRGLLSYKIFSIIFSDLPIFLAEKLNAYIRRGAWDRDECSVSWFQTFKYGREYCKHAAHTMVPNIIQTAHTALP